MMLLASICRRSSCASALRDCISTYVYFVVFFALGLLFTLMSGGAFSSASVDFGTGGKVLINSPYALNWSSPTSASSARHHRRHRRPGDVPGHRQQPDVVLLHRAHHEARLPRRALSRRLRAAGCHLRQRRPGRVGRHAHRHGIDTTRVGPQMAAAYVQPYLINVLPNLLFLTAIFFALATLSRKMLPVYVGQRAGADRLLHRRRRPPRRSRQPACALRCSIRWAARPSTASPRYWTIVPAQHAAHPARRNPAGESRACGWASARSSWRHLRRSSPSPTRPSASEAPRTGRERRDAGLRQSLPIAHPTFSAARLASPVCVSLTRLQLTETMKNVFFLVLMLAGFLFVIVAALGTRRAYGHADLARDLLMVLDGRRRFGLFVLAIIIFYSGELVWRERDCPAQSGDRRACPSSAGSCSARSCSR